MSVNAEPYGWSVRRQSRLPQVYVVRDEQERYVGEVRRGFLGRWLIDAGCDSSLGTAFASRDEAVTALCAWWEDRGRHLPGPRRDPADD